jgi:hypothetical protein
MKEECEFCKNKLTTKGNLVFHQKNNKRCLEIQKSLSVEINSELKECEFCNKKFNVINISRHLLSCKKKKEINNNNNNKIELEKILLNKDEKIYELEKILLIRDEKMYNYENKITELEKINFQKDDKIYQLEIKIHELQAENNIYKNIYEKDHQVITNMAQQPKNTTTNTNHIVNNLAVYDNKVITDRFTDVLNNIKPTDLYDGQESISRFLVPCLKNDDGTQMYKCTDYSRGVYIKKDHHGNIIKDINGKNLVELIEPIASKKAEELLEEDNNKRDKQRKLRYLKKHIENQYEEIENIKQHMKGYKTDSERWNYHNLKIKRIEDDIKKSIQEQDELENEGINELEDEICDDKLTDGVNDIKNMKKDSSKFSKKLSKLLN